LQLNNQISINQPKAKGGNIWGRISNEGFLEFGNQLQLLHEMGEGDGIRMEWIEHL